MSGTSLTFTPSGKTIKDWMEDNESFVKLLVGPLGSGKTAGACVEILRRAQLQAPGPDGIRRTRWACIRNTFAELKSTTIKSWIQWCPSQFGKLTMGGSPITHRIQTGNLDLEVFFIPLDSDEDIRKLLSLELTGGWIDEFREIPKSVLDALTGRVGRYPSRMQGGCTWSGILGTSNPSDTESWPYQIACAPPDGWKVYRQPSGRSPQAENLSNLPERYYERMMAGKDPEWIKVFVDGEFGFVVQGKVVYPAYRDSVHVATEPIPAVPQLPLILGADWGLTPAAAICQQFPDGRVVCLDEFVCEDSGIVRFAQGLVAYLKVNYPGLPVAIAMGDPAGTARGNDERTVFEIMNAETPWRWRPAPTNDITMRIEAVTAFLNRLVDGKPGFQLSPKCGVLRKGFNGGYHFAKLSSSIGGLTFHETPQKNQYSHPHDALQYAVLAVGGADLVLNRHRDRTRPVTIADGTGDPVFADQVPTVPKRNEDWGNRRPASLDPNARKRIAYGGADIILPD